MGTIVRAGTPRASLFASTVCGGNVIEQRRAAYEALGDLFPLAADVRAEQVAAHGVPAEWTSTPVASTSEVILYLHGGGYAWGSLKSHRHLVSEVGRAATMRTLALDYRRAPEFPFPQALEDAFSGFRLRGRQSWKAAA
jgi:acetyl esterase/lipase